MCRQLEWKISRWKIKNLPVTNGEIFGDGKLKFPTLYITRLTKMQVLIVPELVLYSHAKVIKNQLLSNDSLKNGRIKAFTPHSWQQRFLGNSLKRTHTIRLQFRIHYTLIYSVHFTYVVWYHVPHQ